MNKSKIQKNSLLLGTNSFKTDPAC